MGLYVRANVIDCARVFVCAVRGLRRLTVDDDGDLVPAGPVLVLDLADESGVDGVVHLPHRQLVAVRHHIVWQRARRPGEKGARGKGSKVERGGGGENMEREGEK